MGFFEDLMRFKNQKLFTGSTKSTPLDVQRLKESGFGSFKPLKFTGRVPDTFANPLKFFGSFDINRVFKKK